MTRLVLRANAVAAAALGVVLLAATWNDLYEALGVPHPDIAIYAQVAGALALGHSYLLWIAPRDDRVTQAVAAGSAIANGLAALVGAVWLVRERFDVPAAVGLLALTAAAAAFAAAEARIASRGFAMLVPGD